MATVVDREAEQIDLMWLTSTAEIEATTRAYVHAAVTVGFVAEGAEVGDPRRRERVGSCRSRARSARRCCLSFHRRPETAHQQDRRGEHCTTTPIARPASANGSTKATVSRR